MTINWFDFTPLSAVLGGVMIGIAAAMLLLFNGRIAGISGILGGLMRPQKGEVPWRLAFVLGLLVSPVVYALFGDIPQVHIEASWPVLALAGILVGVGTRYASGCTSGHAVCGLSRLSPRSLVATGVFMAAGFVTVFVVRHLIGV